MLSTFSYDLQGHSQLWNRTDLDKNFLTLKRVHSNLKSKYTQLRSVLLDFQSFTEKPVFRCAFGQNYHTCIWLKQELMVKNSMDRVSVICKLAMNGI